MGRKRHPQIREFILDNLGNHAYDITATTASAFGITRQAVNRYLHELIDEGLIEGRGKTRNRHYVFRTLVSDTFELEISPDLQEDRVWRNNVFPLIKHLPGNIIDICHYGFTEMLNNVIDHSESGSATCYIEYSASNVLIIINDPGIGIFDKIKNALGLEDARHALLELAKGKLTTDPKRHSGEGIFFTSRMFDDYVIRSGNLFFSRFDNEDWLLETENYQQGTIILMEISPRSKRKLQEIFDKFTSEHDDYGFTKTHVPVQLARYEGDTLVSRSQAKRLLARFDQFKEVFLDFSDIENIGQAFADEIFRVFRNAHPDIKLMWTNANPDVENMIRRALSSTIH